MRLRNLKASFILKQKVSTPGREKNFTFKHEEFTFNIYRHSSMLVNVTGVKCFESLNKKMIETKLNQNVVKARIDNTFYSQKNYRNIDLVYEFMQHHENLHVDYNIELFEGMYFHPK